MKRSTLSASLLPCLFVAFTRLCAQDQQQETLQRVDFVRDVRPILSDKCFDCHGPDGETRETELRFDLEESAKADLGGYFAIVPGDLEASEIIERIVSEDESYRMPPDYAHNNLTAAEIEILKQWILQGAPWSDHWAYIEPVKHDVRPVSSDWPNNWVDHFILRRLQSENLNPNEDADDITLIRRLHFDLTGLPPPPEVVKRYQSGQISYSALVDELLSSDHFGERLAVYWLDLVRFADTVGYHGDQDHNITPYRDWVIDAFNRNVPFDQFTREQLAGDLLPDPTVDQKIATGYNRLLQTSHEGGVQPKEYIAIYAADRVRNVSQVWMGATVGCAQCHDHKYDPYTLKDFYALSAFFADIDDEEHILKGTNTLPTKRAPEILVHTRRERERLAELKQRYQQMTADDAREVDETRVQNLEAKIKELEESKRAIMITVPLETPRTTKILPRGSWLDESGDIVEPAVPEFMEPIDLGRRANRLDLANWLVDSEKGVGKLTARVFVNRLWAQFFGVGLCPSLDDLGGQGSPPNHEELLDNLAIEFIESDWDIKHMIRLMISSRTYQQSSDANKEKRDRDPQNHLFARQSSYRLPAEFIRDNALAVSGLLNRKIGGASVKPYQPAGYYRHLNFPTRTYEQHSDQRQYRRGLYVHWQRQFLHPMLYAFDAPRREECTAQRARSNTPSAALVLLNDPTFVEAAKALASRVMRETGLSEHERIHLLFQTVLSRTPDEFEMTTLRTLLNENREQFKKGDAHAAKLLKTGLSRVDEGVDQNELAAWMMVSRVVLNLAEANTRN